MGTRKKCVQVTSAINGSGLRHVLTEVLKYAKTGASAASESTNQLAEALAKLHPEMTQEKILWCLYSQNSRWSGTVGTTVDCDLDHFRELNTIHGHLVDDQVLKVIAKILKSQLKGRDFVTGYCGEEFTITLNNTSMGYARQLAKPFVKKFPISASSVKTAKSP